MAYIGSASNNEECDARPLEIERYHSDERGGMRVGDANPSRPAGVVSARETNSGAIATFRGQEQLRRYSGR